MTDGEDRRIAAATIRSLASHQDDAARGISSAVLAVQGVSDNMTKTHGLICAMTNAAVMAAETERSTAGNRTAGMLGNSAMPPTSTMRPIWRRRARSTTRCLPAETGCRESRDGRRP